MIKQKIKIEFLYFEGCPSWQQGLQNLRVALEELQIDADVQMTLVESPEHAQQVGFYGSPSIKINGRDLGGRQGDFSFNCRIYEEEGSLSGIPTVQYLIKHLRNFVF